jgi:hypothetical protein
MNGLKFEACDYGNHNASYDLNRYAIGIYDEKKNSIVLQPVHHIFAMNIVHANQDIVPEMKSSLSNYDRKHDLTEAFGSKKKKRAMKQQESNTISSESITGASAIHDAIGVTLSAEKSSEGADDEGIVLDAATQALAAHRDLMLPAHNINGTNLSEAYPSKTLYSGAAHHSLKEWIDKMATEVQEMLMTASTPAASSSSSSPLAHWKAVLQQRGVSEICLDLIETLYATKVTSSVDAAGLKQFQKSLQLIVFLSCLLKFCEALVSNSKEKPVARDAIATLMGDAPVPLLRYLTDTFSMHKKMNGAHAFQATKTHA